MHPKNISEPEEDRPHINRYNKAKNILQHNNTLVMEYLEDDDEDNPVSYWLTPTGTTLRLSCNSLRIAIFSD